MDTNGDVINHALDWLWAAVAGAVSVIGAAIVRLWRHEERIKALEGHHLQKIEVLARLSDKVDVNHREVTSRIDSLGKDIRDDLRIIMNRCLTVGHGD